jgi:hypothetical protein
MRPSLSIAAEDAELRAGRELPMAKNAGESFFKPSNVIALAAVMIALAAAVISFIALYFTNLRKIDDIRVIYSNDPNIQIDNEKHEFVFTPSSQDVLFFENFGSRPAAIINTNFRAVQPDKDGKNKRLRCPQR